MIEEMFNAVSVVSYVPGRIRFHLGFQGDEILADYLRREIGRVGTAKLEAYSNRTRNALVTYDEGRVPEVEVAQALLRGIQEFVRVHGMCDLENHERNHEKEKHKHAHAGDDCDHDHT